MDMHTFITKAYRQEADSFGIDAPPLVFKDLARDHRYRNYHPAQTPYAATWYLWDGPIVWQGPGHVQDITMNTLFVDAFTKEEAIYCIRHELAHAVAMEEQIDFGHGHRWAEVCAEMGIVPIESVVISGHKSLFPYIPESAWLQHVKTFDPAELFLR